MVVKEKSTAKVDQWKIAPHVLELKSSVIRDILKVSSQPGVISFAGGLPAAELFPQDDMKWALEEVFNKYGPAVMQYSLSRGIQPLCELLAERATKEGSPTTAENIQITSGSQQGLELVSRVFITPGDYILTELPTYVGAVQVFNYYQAKYATVEMDSEGMIIDQVQEKLEKYKPKFIYTIASFQNPTGITMSTERRHQLIELAAKYNVPVIDDNPYSAIRFSGEALPSLKSIGGDQVITLQTFSKILAPGLRIAWMNGPMEIMERFEKVKQCTDLHTNTLCQYLIYEYVATGKLEPHIEEIKKDYLSKRNMMVKTLSETFPKGITWTEPDGGLFLWVELPKHISAKELLPKAVEKKVAYVYGEPFYPNGGGENCMRLNFSNATLEEIVEGIGRLAELLKENM
ncbi:MAG: PLP-dependent aminotransferase family protein [candidate division Zixibacteria bacterium]|nr:PLP-dependent aminotransferase family protein [candidate division Zixibacteria bacterium]